MPREALHEPVEVKHPKGAFLISTDRDRLDLGLIHDFLSHSSYWAEGRSLPVVRTSIEHSLCFGVYEGERQVGFARVVTDHATFAWLCDVFIVESYRGRGLGKWLVECVVAYPSLKDLKLFLLATRDAHGLYRTYGGFEVPPASEKLMVRQRS